MNIIDGTKIAQEIREEIKREIRQIDQRAPGLAFILIGEDPSSQTYVRMKKRRCREVGIYSEVLTLPQEVSEKALIANIDRLNQAPYIDGILVQQPLPSHLSTAKIVEAIDPSKDVDGFHPLNLGKLLLGQKGGFIPCTPLGIVKLLEKKGIDPAGQHVVIVGRSNNVGKPLAATLIQKKHFCNATVTIAHRETKDLPSICQEAQILIVALGQAGFIKGDMVKKGAVVIDVGINRTEDNRLVGDVDFEGVKKVCSAITPVPGGVGPMTIAMLLSNTLVSYKQR